MEYEVEREHGQYHVREKGQLSRGTTMTDGWLKQMGFWPLSRLNIQNAVDAVFAAKGGMVLDPSSKLPRDIAFTPGFKNFPTTPTTGRLQRNPAGIANTANTQRKRPRIPERMLFRAK